MKLYTIPISPNCRRAEATAYHLGLDVEIVRTGFLNGELKSNDFLKLNPNGKVPLLIDDGFRLWESNAILQYLADKSAAADFFPRDFAVRADIVRWQFWESLHFNKAVGGIVWETIAKPSMNLGEPDESAIESSTEDFHRFAKILERQLEGRKFIMGDTLTLADFSVGNHSALAVHPHSRVPLDDYPRVASWYHALEDTPAWARTAPSI